MSATFSNDKLSSYEDFPEKNGSVSVHRKSIQSTAIQILQIKQGQSREIVNDILAQTTPE